MKLYIPNLGDQLRLVSDWTFLLYNEGRNESLMEFLKDNRETEYATRMTGLPVTIPAGNILKVDRIYIRKGQEEFNSMTFLWKDMSIPGRTEERTGSRFDSLFAKAPTKFKYTKKIPKKPVRFWVKMDDANQIEFDIV
jgi:hypothetical protein